MTVEFSRKRVDMYALGLGLLSFAPSTIMLLTLAKVLPGTEPNLYSNEQYMIIGGISGTGILVGLMLTLIAFGRGHKHVMLTIAVLATCSMLLALVGAYKFAQLMA